MAALLVGVSLCLATGSAASQQALPVRPSTAERDRLAYSPAEARAADELNAAEKQVGPIHTATADAAEALATAHRDSSRFTEAEALFKRSLAIRQRLLGPDNVGVGKVLDLLGGLYWTVGRYRDAEPVLERALAIREKAHGRDHIDTAQSLNALGLNHWSRGRFADAEIVLRRAVLIREKLLGPEHAALASSLNNLGIVYREQGRYAEADPVLQRALAMRQKVLGPRHPFVGLSLNNLANSYRYQGRHAEAEPLLKTALALREAARGPNHADVAHSLNSLGGFYYSLARFQEAEPMLARAVAIRERALPPDHPDLASSLNTLGALYREQGRYAEAETLLRRALASRRSALGENHPDTGYAAANLARLYQRMHRHNEAIDLSRSAVNAMRQVGGSAGRGEAGAEPALGTRPERRVLTAHTGIIAEALARGFGEEQALTAEAFETMQLARSSTAGSAVSQFSARLATGDSGLALLVRERQDMADNVESLTQALAMASGRPVEQRDAAREQRTRGELADLTLNLSRLDARLRRDYPRFADLSRPQPTALPEVQELLAADEAMIVFVAAGDATYRLLVRRDAVRLDAIDIRVGVLGRQIRTIRESLDMSAGGLQPFAAQESHALYKILLESAATFLRGASRLIVVPDGPLLGLPLSVLLTRPPPEDGGKISNYRDLGWLVRDYAIAVLPTIGSLRALRTVAVDARRAPLPFVGFGDPAVGNRPGAAQGSNPLLQLASRGAIADVSLVRQLDSLPETADELSRVAASLGSGAKDVFLREQATERRLKTMDLSRFRVVVFATHAIMAGEFNGFGEPALVLTPPETGDATDDGLLSASEVAQLKLNADWVVLSACNTAAPDGAPGAEGLSGLARAFFYAGSRALLVSHWPVVSDAAVKLSTGTFAAVARNPALGRAQALREAMIAMLDERGAPEHFTHPAVWAPFSLVGDAGAN